MNKDVDLELTHINHFGSSPEKQTSNQSAVLELIGAQLSSALLDIEKSQGIITGFFEKVLKDIGEIDSGVAELESIDDGRALKLKLQELKLTATNSIVEFQTFDRTEQRLRSAIANLHLVSDNLHLNEQEHLKLMKGSYSLADQQALHDLVIAGCNRTQLLDQCFSLFKEPEDDGIELF